MKKALILTVLFALVISLNVVVAQNNKKDVIGNWKYEVPSAPYGYEKGTLVISEKEGKLAGEVKFSDGYKIEMKTVAYESGVLKCGLYVDSNYVSISGKVEDEKITGTVNTPDGELKLSAEKQK